MQSVGPFFGTKPKRTVVCSQSSNYAKTLKGEYSAEVSLLPWYETYTDCAKILKGQYSAAISLLYYET